MALDADRTGSDLDALFLTGRIEALLQGEPARRVRFSKVSAEAERMFVSFFSFVMLTSISSAREFSPTIWPSVHLGGGFDEEGSAVLQVDHRVRGDHSWAVGDERAVDAGKLDVAGPRGVSGGDRVRNAGAASLGEETGAESDETTRGEP